MRRGEIEEALQLTQRTIELFSDDARSGCATSQMIIKALEHAQLNISEFLPDKEKLLMRERYEARHGKLPPHRDNPQFKKLN